jgi:histidyl-tRNA synthetase
LQTTDLNKIQEFVKIDKNAKEEISKLKEILDFLKTSFGIKDCNIKMGIVRGLDYYKGTVFEIDASKLGAEKQLCGGGAYELVELFGGRKTPTSGFAIGFDRTILALEAEEYKFPKQKIDTFVIPVDEDMIDKALQITAELRKIGLTVDVDLMRRGIGKSLKYASSINANKAIIVGPKELKKESFTIRDMKTGEQKTVKIKDLEKQFLELK